MSEDDNPFDCFGFDDEEEEIQDLDKQPDLLDGENNTSTIRDEESSGVLAFHANTERSLLMHVKNCALDDNELLPCQHVLKEIDWFCSSRHWMMNVGPEKGSIIQQCLQEAMHKKSSGERQTFVAVELGTYCGYGSIFLSSILKIDPEKYQDCMEFKLLTVEINPKYSAIAKEMIKIAQLGDIVTVLDNDLLMDGSTGNVAALIKSAMAEKLGLDSSPIDFLTIDHDKDSYLSDLMRLERSGMIRRGTIVAADNVIFAGIQEYIDYMQGLAKEGIVKTCTREALVEYSHIDQNLEDGVEITEYLRDPSRID